ncbi:hypothetical protein IAU59_002471 [Kwoniella sp. CBS 9459]
MQQQEPLLPSSQHYTPQHGSFLPPSSQPVQSQSPWTLNLPYGPFLRPSQIFPPYSMPYTQSQLPLGPNQAVASLVPSQPSTPYTAIQPSFPPPSPAQPPFMPSSVQQRATQFTSLTEPYTQPLGQTVGQNQAALPTEPSGQPASSQQLRPPPSPVPSSRARVDSYRPTPASVSVRSAEDVYKEEREKNQTKAERILTKLCEVSGQISTLHGDLVIVKNDNRQLHTDLDTIKNDNRQLRDQIHELQLGQRALATKDEIVEEMVNHVTPIVADHLQNYVDRCDEMQNTLPNTIASQVGHKLQDFADRSQHAAITTKQPSPEAVSSLLARLSEKVAVVERLVTSLHHLEELPEALTYVVGLKDSLKNMVQTVEQPQARTTPSVSGPPAHASSVNIPANSDMPINLFNKLEQAIKTVYDARDALYQQRTQPQSIIDLLRAISLDPNVKLLLHQMLVLSAPPIHMQDGQQNQQAVSNLNTLAQVAASHRVAPADQHTPVPRQLMTPVSNDRSLSDYQLTGYGQNARREADEHAAPCGSHATSPMHEIPPAFSNPCISPTASHSNSRSTSSLRSPIVLSSIQHKTSRAGARTSLAKDDKKRSSNSPAASSRKGSPIKKALDPSDRPFTRSMSTNAPPRRTYTFSQPGATLEDPLEISSGSSGGSPTNNTQTTDRRQSALPQPAQSAVAISATGDDNEGSLTPSDGQEISKSVETQTEAGSFPSQPKLRSQPLKTYGSRSSTAFGSQMSTTSTLGGSRKRMRSSLAMEMEKKHVRNRRVTNPFLGTAQDPSAYSKKNPHGKPTKRAIYNDEDEDESME